MFQGSSFYEVEMKYHVLTFLLLIGSAFAAEPAQQPSPAPTPTVSQQITGAEKPIPLGELVDLRVISQATLKDATAFSTDWSVFDLETRKEQKFKFYRELDTDTVEGVVFGAGTEPRELYVHCAVTYLIIKKEADKITQAGTKTELLKVKVIIGTGPQPPGPNPKPVIPDVKFPNEKLGLSTKVYKAVMERGPPTNRKAGATVLATSFRGINSAIAAGALKAPVDILKKSKEANGAAITTAGLKIQDWTGTFTVVQDELFALYEAGTITTAEQFGSAFSEIADAFDAVR